MVLWSQHKAQLQAALAVSLQASAHIHAVAVKVGDAVLDFGDRLQDDLGVAYRALTSAGTAAASDLYIVTMSSLWKGCLRDGLTFMVGP